MPPSQLVFTCLVTYPHLRTNITATLLLSIYAALLNDLLEAPLYPASEAGMSGGYDATGITLQLLVSGYTDPSSKVLMVLLMAAKRSLFTKARFDVMKEQLVKV